MGRPIEIKLDAETTAAERNLGSTADSLDDVADALDKVDDATRDADRGLEDVADGARDAERGLQDTKDAADDTARVLDRDLTKALDGVKESAREIKESFEENALTPEDVFKADLKAELVSNMAESGAEAARGFKDGFSAEDAGTIIDGITDTMVQVGTLGGPVGTAAGLAGASVVQMFAGPFLADAEATAAQFESTFSTAFSNIVENGADVGRELSIRSSVDEFVQDTQKMNTATEAANKLGVERGIVFRAMAGDQDALNIINDRAAAITDDLTQKQADLAAQQFKTTEDQVAAGQAITDLGADMSDLDSVVAGVTGTYKTNTDALNAASEAASAKAEADAYATKKATEQALATAASTGQAQIFTAVVDGATRSLAALPSGKVVEVTDDGTVTSTQVAIDSIHGGTATVEVKPNVVQSAFQATVDAAARLINPPIVPAVVTVRPQRMV